MKLIKYVLLFALICWNSAFGEVVFNPANTGSTSITTVGTVTTGAWQATPIENGEGK